jgi:integrase
MGLGSWPAVSLAEARTAAAAARKLVRQGVDPIAQRRDARAEAAKMAVLEQTQAITLDQQFDEFFSLFEKGLSNAKHRSQWRHTWRDYVSPVLGTRPVASITIDDVLTVLKPIWYEKPETAVRLRGRLEMVLQAAIVKGHHPGPNPSTWHNQLQTFLRPRSKIAEVKHHPAIDWRELPEFMRELRHLGGFGAMALEWIILNVVRSEAGRGALWSEIDRDRAIWTVPRSRNMKSGREHRVPLSTAALAILDKAAAVRSSDAVFPGQDGRKPLSETALTVVLRRLGRTDITVHGMRAAFKTWATEHDKPGAPVELAMEHTLSKLEAAYQRSDLLDKRRVLMEEWAAWCGGQNG